MFKKILILGLVIVAVGCSKKKKDDGSMENSGSESADSSVVNQPLSFDASGSDSGKISGLHTINFEYDTATLSSDSKQKLSDNAKWMKTNAKANVQIEGHCDNRGSIEYNLALGERRAKAVKAYMVSLGVSAKRLSVISYGKEKPLVAGDSESDYSQNRRANFVPLGN